MEPQMICLMALRRAQVQGRLMRMQNCRPRKVVSVQLLSSDLSCDCQVCSDAMVGGSQETRFGKEYCMLVTLIFQCYSE